MHDPPAAMVPPLKLTEPFVAVLAVVTVPAPQDPVSPFGFCTKRLVGKVSLNATPVMALPDGLLMVNVNVEVCPMLRFVGLNDLEMLGGWADNAPDVADKMNKAAAGAASQRKDLPCNDFTIIVYLPYIAILFVACCKAAR